MELEPGISIEPARAGAGDCGVCGGSLAEGAVEVCPACEHPVHVECRSYAGRCPTYGCGSAPAAPVPAPRDEDHTRIAARLEAREHRKLLAALTVGAGGIGAVFFLLTRPPKAGAQGYAIVLAALLYIFFIRIFEWQRSLAERRRIARGEPPGRRGPPRPWSPGTSRPPPGSQTR